MVVNLVGFCSRMQRTPKINCIFTKENCDLSLYKKKVFPQQKLQILYQQPYLRKVVYNNHEKHCTYTVHYNFIYVE